MLGIVIGTVDVENKATYVAQQDNAATYVHQTLKQVEMSLDDTYTKSLRSFLVATMTLLFSKELGSDALHMVKDVEERVAEEL